MRPWNQLSSIPRIQPSSIDPPPKVSRCSKISVGLAFHLVGQRLDEPRTTQRISDMGNVRLVSDDLLSAQGDTRRLGRRQRHRLIHRVRMQALGATQHPGQRLDRRAHDVHLRLLSGQRHPRRLGMEPQHATNDHRPPRNGHASTAPRTCRAARYLAISSKKSMCALKKKLSRGANASTGNPDCIANST